MNTLSELQDKLARSKEYREAFVASQLKRGIPFQIRALRKQRGRDWSQERLAHEASLTQGAISRAEDPDYGNLTLNTLLRIAAGFDVAFVGRFAPFSELGRWFLNQSETTVQVPSFEDDAGFIEHKEPQRQHAQEPAAGTLASVLSGKIFVRPDFTAGEPTITSADLLHGLDLARTTRILRGFSGTFADPGCETRSFFGYSRGIPGAASPSSPSGAMKSPLLAPQGSLGESQRKLLVMPKRPADQLMKAFNPPPGAVA